MSQWRVRAALVALVVTFGVGLWLRWDEVSVGMKRWTTESREPAASSEVTMGAEAVEPERRLGQEEQAEAGSPLVAELMKRSGPPEKDLEIVRQLISQYFTAMQNLPGPPVGDNADLMRAMSGNNPLRLKVIPEGSPVLGAGGQLLDRWGTAFHLHKLAESYFEIRSAGPDQKLFTGDDAVGR
jgi:hypothetical protein